MEWIALVISALAFLLSVLSYRHAKLTQERTWRLEAKRASVRLRLTLDGMQDKIRAGRGNAHAGFASMGMFHSGARKLFDEKCDQLASNAEKILKSLNDTTKDIDTMSDSKLERCLVEIESLERRTDEITSWLNEKDVEHAKLVDERRQKLNALDTD